MSYAISPVQIETNALTGDKIKRDELNEEQILFNAEHQEVDAATIATEDEEITIAEGLKLFGQGALNKIKDIGSAIIKHPLKTIAAVGGTTAALAALPLVGISSATGAAALAIGFGAFSIYNAGKDAIETVKDYQDGKFDEVREDIQELGGDGVDLAMSLPFMPKAAKQLGRAAKYGTSTIGLNSSLISSLNRASSLDDVLIAFGQANTKINYEIMGNELGYVTKPQLEFIDDVNASNGVNMQALYDFTTGKIKVSNSMFTTKGMLNRAVGAIVSGDTTTIKTTTETALRHELQHFQQASDIVQQFGTQALADAITAQQRSVLEGTGLFDDVASLTPSSYEARMVKMQLEMSLGPELADNVINMALGDRSAFNTGFYDDVIRNNPIVSNSSQAQTWLNGYVNRANEMQAVQSATTPQEFVEIYSNTTLEKPAYAAQFEYYDANCAQRPGLTSDNLMAAGQARETFSDEDKTLLEVLKDMCQGKYAKTSIFGVWSELFNNENA